jgi:hypothetical protein
MSQEISLSVVPAPARRIQALRQLKPQPACGLEPAAAQARMRHDTSSWSTPRAAHVL